MSTVNECLHYIIGLAKNDCICTSADRPSDFDTSESELYITDLIPTDYLSAIANCENGVVWDILERSRTEAISLFLADANGLLLQKNQLKRQPFTGKIGETLTKQVKPLTNTYGGLICYCADILSGTLTINAIGTLFEKNGTVDVTIVDNTGVVYGTYSLATTAMKYCNNSIVPLVLEFHSEETRNIIYYIYYTYDSNNKPLRNQHTGTCCGANKLIYNNNKPYFNDSGIQPRNNWARWMMVAGFQTSTLSNIYDPSINIGTEQYLNGLTLDVSLKCNTKEVFCKDSINYESNPLANIMAYAICYKAVHICINKILVSNIINRNKFTNTEAMIEITKQMNEDYQKYLAYCVENVYLKTNDCFECRNIINAMKSGIFL